jgi:hypothetical protein
MDQQQQQRLKQVQEKQGSDKLTNAVNEVKKAVDELKNTTLTTKVVSYPKAPDKAVQDVKVLNQKEVVFPKVQKVEVLNQEKIKIPEVKFPDIQKVQMINPPDYKPQINVTVPEVKVPEPKVTVNVPEIRVPEVKIDLDKTNRLLQRLVDREEEKEINITLELI